MSHNKTCYMVLDYWLCPSPKRNYAINKRERAEEKRCYEQKRAGERQQYEG